MSAITVTFDTEDGELEYDVAFTMSARPARQTWATPAEAAEFEIFQIWNEEGTNVTGKEFDLVAEEARGCYYEAMLAEAMGR